MNYVKIWEIQQHYPHKYFICYGKMTIGHKEDANVQLLFIRIIQQLFTFGIQWIFKWFWPNSSFVFPHYNPQIKSSHDTYHCVGASLINFKYLYMCQFWSISQLNVFWSVDDCIIYIELLLSKKPRQTLTRKKMYYLFI